MDKYDFESDSDSDYASVTSEVSRRNKAFQNPGSMLLDFLTDPTSDIKNLNLDERLSASIKTTYDNLSGSGVKRLEPYHPQDWDDYLAAFPDVDEDVDFMEDFNHEYFQPVSNISIPFKVDGKSIDWAGSPAYLVGLTPRPLEEIVDTAVEEQDEDSVSRFKLESECQGSISPYFIDMINQLANKSNNVSIDGQQIYQSIVSLLQERQKCFQDWSFHSFPIYDFDDVVLDDIQDEWESIISEYLENKREGDFRHNVRFLNELFRRSVHYQDEVKDEAQLLEFEKSFCSSSKQNSFQGSFLPSVDMSTGGFVPLVRVCSPEFATIGDFQSDNFEPSASLMNLMSYPLKEKERDSGLRFGLAPDVYSSREMSASIHHRKRRKTIQSN